MYTSKHVNQKTELLLVPFRNFAPYFSQKKDKPFLSSLCPKTPK